MKIHFFNNSNQYVINRKVSFKGAAEDLEQLSNIEKLLKQQYETEIEQIEIHLAGTYTNIDTAEESIRMLKERLGSQKKEIEQLSSINKNARNALDSFMPSIQKLVEQKKEYEDKIQQLPEYEKNLKTKAETIILQNRQKSFSIITERAAQINNSIKNEALQLRSINFPKSDGFGTIAGFDKVKSAIKSFIGEPIVMEQTGKLSNVPSGVLFYGPDAENNLNIAKSIANQFDCNCAIVPSDIENSKKMDFLEEIVVNARNRFISDKKRTIAIIDDFDNFPIKTKRDRGIFKAFLDNISSMYSTTIVAISQNPQTLDPIILRDGRFNKIPIANASFKDLVEIVKRYLPLDLIDRIDIVKFAKQIFKLQGEDAFSVKQIKELTTSFADKLPEIHNIKPQISKDKILHFKEQLKLLKSI